MNHQALLIIIIGILTVDFLITQILEYINLRHEHKKLPAELEGIYDPEKSEKAREYHKANTKFGFASSSFSYLLSVIVIITGLLGYLEKYLNNIFTNPIYLSMAFFGILFILSDLINIPFSLYRTFVIEEKFGFNKTTIKTFITDKLKGYLLGIIIGGIIIFILLHLILHLKENFWIWFWLFASLLLLLVNMFYTSLIVPLFNKLIPLKEGELQTAINDYSARVNFPLDNIFVIDGSRRSSKANAFFSGIGKKKKIVLYDTLINNHSIQELVAVLAHEVGHFKKKHIIVGFILSILQVGLMLFLLSLILFNMEISIAMGTEALSIHINLLAFGILFSPVSHFLGIFMNLISRKNEFEADAYAATTYDGKALQNALKKLSVNNLSNLNPHPAYVFVHYSHPPVGQRLKALNAASGKAVNI